MDKRDNKFPVRTANAAAQNSVSLEMKDIQTIKIGIGLGDLKFGSSREKVKAYLGNPEQITEDSEKGDRQIAWNYWSQELSVHFDEEDEFKLGCFETSNSSSTLYGNQLIGKHINAFLSIIQKEDFGESKIDPEFFVHDNFIVCKVSFEDCGLNF